MLTSCFSVSDTLDVSRAKRFTCANTWWCHGSGWEIMRHHPHAGRTLLLLLRLVVVASTDSWNLVSLFLRMDPP